MDYPLTSSYQPLATTPQTTPPVEAAESVAGITQRLLQDCLRKAREWEGLLPVGRAEQQTAVQLRNLAEDLLIGGTPSIIAMCKVRKLLCSNCRQLHAAHEQCDGEILQPLDQCMLLKELSH